MTNDTSRQLADLLAPGDTLMVGTGQADAITSRPLTVARIDASHIQILMDRSAQWAQQLTGTFPTLVTMSDNRANRWVALSGHASITTDRALIDDLWNPFAGSFFEDGKESPNVAVMTIEVDGGEYWDSPSGRLGSLFTLLKARLTDARHVGEHGDVSVDG